MPQHSIISLRIVIKAINHFSPCQYQKENQIIEETYSLEWRVCQQNIIIVIFKLFSHLQRCSQLQVRATWKGLEQ